MSSRIFYKNKKNYVNLDLNVITITPFLNLLSVRGLLGKLNYRLQFPLFYFKNEILFIHYRYRRFFFKFLDFLVFNVTFGFSIEMSVHGFGIRASFFEDSLFFDLGYSHICQYNLGFPVSVKFVSEFESFSEYNFVLKFYNNCFLLYGINFDFISNLCSFFRHQLSVSPYRLKGLIYLNESFKFKVGKRE